MEVLFLFLMTCKKWIKILKKKMDALINLKLNIIKFSKFFHIKFENFRFRIS